MALLEIRWHPTTRELRQFGALLAVFLCTIAYWWRGSRWFVVAAFGVAAVLAALLAWRRPQSLRMVYVAWICAAFPIGLVVSHVLLAAIYYLLLTPLGFLLRWTGYDPLKQSRDLTRDSYWEPRLPTADRRQYFRQF